MKENEHPYPYNLQPSDLSPIEDAPDTHREHYLRMISGSSREIAGIASYLHEQYGKGAVLFDFHTPDVRPECRMDLMPFSYHVPVSFLWSSTLTFIAPRITGDGPRKVALLQEGIATCDIQRQHVTVVLFPDGEAVYGVKYNPPGFKDYPDGLRCPSAFDSHEAANQYFKKLSVTFGQR